MACLVTGECCQNAQKQFIIKTYKELILYKHVGIYQFKKRCIRALVMNAYLVITCLIYQPKHNYVVGTQKNRRNETVILSTNI